MRNPWRGRRPQRLARLERRRLGVLPAPRLQVLPWRTLRARPASVMLQSHSRTGLRPPARANPKTKNPASTETGFLAVVAFFSGLLFFARRTGFADRQALELLLLLV